MTLSFPLVASLVGAGWVLVGGLLLREGTRSRRRLQGWPRTDGTVVTSEWRYTRTGPGADGSWLRFPTYAWRDHRGTDHAKESTTGSSPGFRPGTPVTVAYDPLDPSDGVIDSFSQNGTLWVVVGTGVGVVGLLVLALTAALALT